MDFVNYDLIGGCHTWAGETYSLEARA